jgi:flagellar basal body-associated protein FliL
VAKAGREKSDKGEKKSKKKLILMIVGFVAIGGFAAKSTVLKPKPLTAQQLEAKKAAEEKELTALCAAHNDLPAPAADDKAASDEHGDGEGDAAAHEPELAEEAPVLELDPITVNLDDGHFLKVGVALALEPGTLMEEAKDHGIGAQATNLVIDRVSGEPMAELMPSEARVELRKELGNSICTTYEGRILTIYFTDFVMQ